MSALLGPKLAIARAAGALSRMLADRRFLRLPIGGGTSLPGKLLLRMDRTAIAQLAGRLPRGSVAISATNGKTTTAAMAASVLQAGGARLAHNQAGANMAGGIASTLLAAARRGQAIDGEIGLFEVDELWLDRLVEQLRPRALVLCNLFRDQLDRYGELDTIAERWEQALDSPAGRRARLVCNADDPLLADLGRVRADAPNADNHDTVFFGVEDDSLALPGMAHAADAKHCRRCGAPYVFDAVYLGHLGHYHCPSCAQRRPSPAVIAEEVQLEGVRSARFTLVTPHGRAVVQLSVPGLYNVYNALAAAALGVAMDVPLPQIVAGLQATKAAFGRAESVVVAGRTARILLVKNPAGANEVLRTLALEPGEHDLLGVLNDRTADGHDVSWIWDADFELLAGRVRRAVCSGTRAPELALRLKYAGVEPARIEVVEALSAALDTAVTGQAASTDRAEAAGADVAGKAVRTDAGKTAGATPAPLYILPTYTAMLDLRELLVRRGEAAASWR